MHHLLCIFIPHSFICVIPHIYCFKSCSRVVDAQSPMAIVIPSTGSSFSLKLRDNDVSWQSFLERANDFK